MENHTGPECLRRSAILFFRNCQVWNFILPVAVRLCYCWVKLLFPSKLYIPLCFSTLSLIFLRYCLSSLEDIFTRKWKKPHEHVGISQLLCMCVENHMTGRLDLSLLTLDTHVIYFHSSFSCHSSLSLFFCPRHFFCVSFSLSKFSSLALSKSARDNFMCPPYTTS